MINIVLRMQKLAMRRIPKSQRI